MNMKQILCILFSRELRTSALKSCLVCPRISLKFLLFLCLLPKIKEYIISLIFQGETSLTLKFERLGHSAHKITLGCVLLTSTKGYFDSILLSNFILSSLSTVSLPLSYFFYFVFFSHRFILFLRTHF